MVDVDDALVLVDAVHLTVEALASGVIPRKLPPLRVCRLQTS